MAEASGITRKLPYLCGLLLFILDSVFFRCELAAMAACDLFTMNVMLAMMPYPPEGGYVRARKYVLLLFSACALSTVAFAVFFHGSSGEKMALTVALSVLSLTIFLVRERSFGKKPAMLEYSFRAILVLTVLIIMVAFMETGVYGIRASGLKTVLLLAVMAASSVCLAFRMKGARALRTPLEEREMPSRPASAPDYDAMDEKARMDTLFGRVDALMSEKKLFLDEELTLGDVAGQLSCNKVYVSRAILDKTGYNFRQYINKYRISYALEILGKDPDIKVSELSGLCGFHSQPTFNLAFRMNLHMTPSEWKREFREGRG